MMRRVAIGVGLVACVVATYGEAMAQSRCTGAKLKATSKNVATKGSCYAKAVAKGLPLPAACALKVAAADGKLMAAFTKAEAAADCLGPLGDAGATAAGATGFIGVVNLLTPGPSKCDSAKMKDAAKAAAAKLKCHAKAAAGGPPFLALPGCLLPVDPKLVAMVGMAELVGAGPGLCTFLGAVVPPPPPTGPLGAAVDGFVAPVVAALCPVPGC